MVDFQVPKDVVYFEPNGAADFEKWNKTLCHPIFDGARFDTQIGGQFLL